MCSEIVVTHHGAATKATSSGTNSTWAPEGGCSSVGPWAQRCIAEAGGDRVLGCRRCVLIEDLCHQVKELQEEVYRLNSVTDKKRSLMRSSPRPCSCKSLNSDCTKGGAARGTDVRDLHDGEGRKVFTSGIRQMPPALPADLQLQKKFSVLVADKGLWAVLRAEPGLTEPEPQQHKRQSIHSNRRNSI